MGCHTLLDFNHTVALDFVHASLATFNNNTKNQTFSLLEVGRMTSQVNETAKPKSDYCLLQVLFVPM